MISKTIFMQVADLISTNSYCNRSKVGAVLVKDNRIISMGYNGTPVGMDNECEDREGNTKSIVMHAEINAILYAAKVGIPTEGCTLYVTLSPCVECAKAIIQAGIKTVYYKEQYRNIDGLTLLDKYVKVKRIDDELAE